MFLYSTTESIELRLDSVEDMTDGRLSEAWLWRENIVMFGRVDWLSERGMAID